MPTNRGSKKSTPECIKVTSSNEGYPVKVQKNQQLVLTSLARKCACTVLVLALTILGSGCICCRCPCRTESEAQVAEEPLLKSVIAWLDQRQYHYTVTKRRRESIITAVFADEPGKLPACSCVISAELDMVRVAALLHPSVPADHDADVPKWLAEANFTSFWGFFGYSADSHELWFRIALFRPEGSVTASEMDQVLTEVFSAMHESADFLEENTPASDPLECKPPSESRTI
jgi:hypothetical protein